MADTQEFLVWEDVETTGLDTNRDALLEVAVLVTDTNLNVLDDAGFEATIGHSELDVVAFRSTAPAVVQDMHDTSGLWGRLPAGTPLGDVDEQLAAYLGQFAPDQSHLRPSARKLRLAGSSVKLDLSFTEVNLPSVAAQLNYRVVDVSSVAFLAAEWTGCGYLEKERNHTAMADIRESLSELRWLRSRLLV